MEKKSDDMYLYVRPLGFPHLKTLDRCPAIEKITATEQRKPSSLVRRWQKVNQRIVRPSLGILAAFGCELIAFEVQLTAVEVEPTQK